MRRLVLVALVLASLGADAAASVGIGDRFYFGGRPEPPTEEEIIEQLPFSSIEQLLVIHDSDAKSEHLVLELRFDKADATFGVLIPVPSAPSVEKMARSPFDSLRDIYSFAGGSLLGLGGPRLSELGGGFGAGQGALGQGAEPPPPAVEVLEERPVGAFTSFTIAVHDATELAAWLGEHGFVAPKSISAWAERYARMDFQFVALKHTTSPDAGTAKGMTSEAIHIAFSTPVAYVPYSEIVAPKISKRLVAAWVISSRAARPLARKDSAIAQPWRQGMRYTATRDELALVFKDLAAALPSGKLSVQTFRDWKTSREGWGDVVLAPEAPVTLDEPAKAERRRLLGLLDPDLVPPPKPRVTPPPASSAVASASGAPAPAPAAEEKKGCNVGGGPPSLLAALAIAFVLRRRRALALLGLLGCSKPQPAQDASPTSPSSAPSLAAPSSTAPPPEPAPASTLSSEELASRERVAYAVLGGEAPDGGFVTMAGVAPIPPPPPPPVTFSLSSVKATNLDKDLVRRYLLRMGGRMRYCYERALVEDPTLAGTLTLKFLVTASGDVTSVVPSGDVNKSSVSGCMSNAVRVAQFPAGPAEVEATYVMKKNR